MASLIKLFSGIISCFFWKKKNKECEIVQHCVFVSKKNKMQIDLTLCISYVKHCVNWLIKLRTCMNHNFTGVTNLAPPMVKTVQLRHVVVAAVPKPRVGQALPLQKLFKEVCPVMGSNDHKTAPSTTGTLKSKIASNFLWSPCKEKSVLL